MEPTTQDFSEIAQIFDTLPGPAFIIVGLVALFAGVNGSINLGFFKTGPLGKQRSILLGVIGGALMVFGLVVKFWTPDPNNDPVAGYMVHTVDKNSDYVLLNVDVSDRDSADRDKINVFVVEPPKNGTFNSKNVSRKGIYYKPKKDFVGEDVLQYRASDHHNGKSGKARMTIKVIEPEIKDVLVEHKLQDIFGRELSGKKYALRLDDQVDTIMTSTMGMFNFSGPLGKLGIVEVPYGGRAKTVAFDFVPSAEGKIDSYNPVFDVNFRYSTGYVTKPKEMRGPIDTLEKDFILLSNLNPDKNNAKAGRLYIEVGYFGPNELPYLKAPIVKPEVEFEIMNRSTGTQVEYTDRPKIHFQLWGWRYNLHIPVTPGSYDFKIRSKTGVLIAVSDFRVLDE